MKLRVYAMGAAALMLCSASVAAAREEVRPSQPTVSTKGKPRVIRATTRPQRANQAAGALIPVVIGGVVVGGTAFYFATKEDKSASR